VRGAFGDERAAPVGDALAIADARLEGRVRYDGSPLVLHSVGVAEIVIEEIGLGVSSTVAALLHDVVRLGLMTVEEAGERFGEKSAVILRALCNISGVTIKVDDRQADNYRDLIVSYSTNPRIILIKLADRLEVMRSLAMFPPRKRRQKSLESQKLYAQIAHKLGLYGIKSELEDLSLRWLEPRAYEQIERDLEESASQRRQFIDKFLKPVRARLDEGDIKYTIKSRTKSIYSIWSKMHRTGLPFSEIYDIFALRVIVDCPREQEKQQCWGVYSVVTDFYTPNPERLRDWISIPKSNGYESLHTTVVTREGQWVEIQIRSERMDAVAERGIAAHWRYKGVHQGGMGAEQWLEKLRELIEHDTTGEADGAGALGEIFVFTPKGDLRKLREGATLLDFAFEIHTALGQTCTGGRVNQRNASIREVLHNGDIVEIQTAKSQKPKADWLKIVKTTKARARIRAFLREEQARQAELGREELERRLKNWRIAVTLDEAVTALCKYHKVRTGMEFYNNLAEGRYDLAEMKELLGRLAAGEEIVETPKPRAAKIAVAEAADDSLVIDDSIKNLEYKLARCCNPIRGDEVFGFVTVSAGITIHRTTCPNAARLREQYPYRVLPARWRESVQQGTFQASVRVVTDNESGAVNRVTEAIRQMNVNIRSMSMAPNQRGELAGVINIEVANTRLVDAVVYNLLKIKGVQRAHRVD
jgi:GTP pyrophosphokinase